jgi:hypothetical protein
MKTLKINVPEGYEIDKEQSTFENIVFKEIEKGLPKSWEEIENLQGFFVDYGSDIRVTDVDVIKSEVNRNIFATKEQAEASIALAQLSQLREVYRQGWAPDWGNSNDTKWCIIVHENKLSIREYVVSNSFLSFQSQEIAEQFLDNFRDLIEKAKPLMS